MATDGVEVESSSQQLKYLGFVRVFAIQLIALALKLYEYAKDHSGPLKSLVVRVESAAKAVLGPVYSKSKGVADQILLFFDSLIDSAAKIFDRFAPSFLSKAVHAYLSIVQKATQLTIRFIHEAWANGFRAAILSLLNEFYQFLLPLFTKLQAFLISLLLKMWLSAIKIPSIQNVVGTLVPAATGVLNKYSKGITNVMGGITSVMEKGSSTLSSIPVVGGATKLAAGAASAAQNTVSNAVEQSTAALSKIPLTGDATGAAASAASSAASAASSAASAASSAASAAASAATDTAAAAVGTAASAASTAVSTAEKTVANVLGNLPFS